MSEAPKRLMPWARVVNEKIITQIEELITNADILGKTVFYITKEPENKCYAGDFTDIKIDYDKLIEEGLTDSNS